MKLLTIAVAVISQANAWWDLGHEIVAEIAYEKLQKESPGTID